MNPNKIADAVALPPEFNGVDTAVGGGFVRDGPEKSNDVDLIVTGVEPSDLRDRGFQPVEADAFPVFHDSLGREVALARTERNAGEGHTAFEVNAVPADVPHREALERDLRRRDLTINAMAVDVRTGELFDPHGGVEDLNRGVIRHVSSAFRDDPLRVVRAARFRARLGFTVAPETLALLSDMAPDVGTLPADRFGGELMKALKQADAPRLFFDTLREVGALESVFPALAALVGVPAGPPEHHREGDAFEHTMQVVEEMHARRPNDVVALLGALGHDLGKGTTDADVLPSHHGHASRGGDVAPAMRRRLGLPRSVDGAMSVAARTHMNLHRVTDLNATTLLDMARTVSGSPLSVAQLADLAAADAAGREPATVADTDAIRHRLSVAVDVVENVTGSQALARRGFAPDDVGEEVPGARVQNFVRQDRAEALRGQL